jgi:hydrogenase maturation protease
MDAPQCRCLILACGNSLRGDDGLGPWLAQWARERFRADAGVHVIARLQWTPELAEEIAAAESVVFLDASVEAAPGTVRVAPVESAQDAGEVATHHNDAAHLLQLCCDLYGVAPRSSLLLTVGVGSTELGEGFSEAVAAALPEACRVLERIVGELQI